MWRQDLQNYCNFEDNMCESRSLWFNLISILTKLFARPYMKQPWYLVQFLDTEFNVIQLSDKIK